jgi:hypothetical protein
MSGQRGLTFVAVERQQLTVMWLFVVKGGGERVVLVLETHDLRLEVTDAHAQSPRFLEKAGIHPTDVPEECLGHKMSSAADAEICTVPSPG